MQSIEPSVEPRHRERVWLTARGSCIIFPAGPLTGPRPYHRGNGDPPGLAPRYRVSRTPDREDGKDARDRVRRTEHYPLRVFDGPERSLVRRRALRTCVADPCHLGFAPLPDPELLQVHRLFVPVPMCRCTSRGGRPCTGRPPVATPSLLQSSAVTAPSLFPWLKLCRPEDVRREVPVAEVEPGLLSHPPQLGENVEGVALNPPSLCDVSDPGEGVDGDVDVRANVQPLVPEVVPNVRDDREVARSPVCIPRRSFAEPVPPASATVLNALVLSPEEVVSPRPYHPPDPEVAPPVVHPPDDRDGGQRVLPHDQLGGGRYLVDYRRLRHPEQVPVRVGRPDEVLEGAYARAADRDVDLALPPGPPEGVCDDHGELLSRPSLQLPSSSSGRSRPGRPAAE